MPVGPYGLPVGCKAKIWDLLGINLGDLDVHRKIRETLEDPRIEGVTEPFDAEVDQAAFCERVYDQFKIVWAEKTEGVAWESCCFPGEWGGGPPSRSLPFPRPVLPPSIPLSRPPSIHSSIPSPPRPPAHSLTDSLRSVPPPTLTQTTTRSPPCASGVSAAGLARGGGGPAVSSRESVHAPPRPSPLARPSVLSLTAPPFLFPSLVHHTHPHAAFDVPGLCYGKQSKSVYSIQACLHHKGATNSTYTKYHSFPLDNFITAEVLLARCVCVPRSVRAPRAMYGTRATGPSTDRDHALHHSLQRWKLGSDARVAWAFRFPLPKPVDPRAGLQDGVEYSMRFHNGNLVSGWAGPASRHWEEAGVVADRRC